MTMGKTYVTIYQVWKNTLEPLGTQKLISFTYLYPEIKKDYTLYTMYDVIVSCIQCIVQCTYVSWLPLYVRYI